MFFVSLRWEWGWGDSDENGGHRSTSRDELGCKQLIYPSHFLQQMRRAINYSGCQKLQLSELCYYRAVWDFAITGQYGKLLIFLLIRLRLNCKSKFQLMNCCLCINFSLKFCNL